MTTLSKGDQDVAIEEGELRSFKAGGYEFIHQIGSPGWGHSDTEMFPIIGPTAEASYRVQVPRGNAILDQHGLLRDMPYKLLEENSFSATFVKDYKAGTPVENAKFPDRSTARLLVWPYSFQFSKTFTLDGEGLSIQFSLSGEKDMPYMLGYHPAFRIQGSAPRVKAGNRVITLDEVLAVGSRALRVSGVTEAELRDARNLKISTTGFLDFMLWTEVPNMLCIEPVTFYPYQVPQHQLHTGFNFLENSEERFSVYLQPQDEK
jgi:galactose mutarotase-like enzyme